MVTGQGQRQPATRAYGTNARRMSVCVRREALCRQMDDILLAANIKMLCSGTQYGIISPNDYELWSILPFREEFLQWECGFGRRPPAFQDERRRPVAGIRRLAPGREAGRQERAQTKMKLPDRPLISLIVPVYRTAATLPTCVESVLSQTYPALELILVDDGSPDGAGEICDRYAARDTRVRVLHQTNRGVSAARNAGLAVAQGEYIGFLDSDDWAEPDLLETLLQPFLQDAALDVSVCAWYREAPGDIQVCGGQAYQGRMDGETAVLAMLCEGSIEGYQWNKLFRRRCIFSPGGGPALQLRTDIHICEDLLFCCMVFLRCGGVYYYPKPLVHYLLHEGSALRTYNVKRGTELAARKAILQMLDPKSQPHLWQAACVTYVQAAVNFAAVARANGDRQAARGARKAAGAYLLQAVCAKPFGWKKKVKIVLLYLSPRASLRLWRWVKKRSGWNWSWPTER